MLIDTEVKMKWLKQTKAYYIEKGYVFTKIGEEFIVKTSDLPKGSHKKVRVKCDTCGEIIEKTYRDYLKGQSYDDGFGDLCSKCSYKRAYMQNLKKNGGIGLQSAKIKEKVKQTNLERYGEEYPMMNKEVYKKVRSTQNDKYGGIGMASNLTRKKIEETNLFTYGVKNPSQSEEIKNKKKNTYMQHYGVEHPFKIPEIVSKAVLKARDTLNKNNNVPMSKEEKEIIKLLEEIYGKENCFPSYLVSPLTFDCLLVLGEDKIDVEYDGWYWHKDRQDYDRRRNYKVISLGYKVLRIKSNNLLPTKEEIQNAVNYLTKEKHNYTEIILDI